MSLGVTERLAEPCFDRQDPGGDRSRNRMDQLLKAAEARQYLELVVDCWAGCAHVLVTNGLREWGSYLGFGNESWKRIDDPIGRRDVGLRFLQNVITLDPTALQRREYEVEFVAVWVQTAIARVLSVQDVFTSSLIEAVGGSGMASNQASLLSSLVSEWQSVVVDRDAEQQHRVQTKLDLDAFVLHRPALSLPPIPGSQLPSKLARPALVSSIRFFLHSFLPCERTLKIHPSSNLKVRRRCPVAQRLPRSTT